MAYPYSTQVIRRLWEPAVEEENPQWDVYAILDGARNELIYPAVLQSGCETECLYLGELEPDMAEAAPYLVKLQKDHPFTEWLIKEGWGDSWGIYLRASSPFRDLRRHFRKFLMVYDPNHKPLYFRYYDPRVMRVYLPTCNADELRIVFGPVKLYVMEDSSPTGILQFRLGSSGVLEQQATIPQATQV